MKNYCFLLCLVFLSGCSSLLPNSANSPEENCLEKIEAAVLEENYKDGLKIGSKYFNTYPEWKAGVMASLQKINTVLFSDSLSEAEYKHYEYLVCRSKIAIYTNICLIKTGGYSSDFFSFPKNCTEMKTPLTVPVSDIFFKSFCGAVFFYEMGLYSAAETLLLSDVNLKNNGQTSAKTAFSKKEILLLSKIDALLGKNRMLHTRLYNAEILFPDTSQAWFLERKKAGEFLSGSEGRQTILVDEGSLLADELLLLYYHSFKNNRHLLDAFCLLLLCKKDFHEIPFIVSEYQRLNIALPDYLQEAIVVSNTVSLSRLVSRKILGRVNSAFRDFEEVRMGRLSLDAFAERNSNTYSFYFLSN